MAPFTHTKIFMSLSYLYSLINKWYVLLASLLVLAFAETATAESNACRAYYLEKNGVLIDAVYSYKLGVQTNLVDFQPIEKFGSLLKWTNLKPTPLAYLNNKFSISSNTDRIVNLNLEYSKPLHKNIVIKSTLTREVNGYSVLNNEPIVSAHSLNLVFMYSL